jgi:hypothetical protein
LRRALLLAVLVTALACVATRARAATGEGSARVTMFEEPGKTTQGIRVLHPQADVSATMADTFKIAAGWNLDAVTGATPAVFGPTSGVDAVSGPTKFEDTRHLFHGGFGFQRPDNGISVSGAYGWESDYKTRAISATTYSDLYEHNFRLALAYTHNFDIVCDANNAAAAGMPLQLLPLTASASCFDSTKTDVVSHKLTIDTLEPSLSWTMTPRLVVQGGATIQLLDGFQSNPYRSVRLGSQGATPQERHPLYRQRYAAFARLAYALPEMRASAIGMLRLYDDSWAVRAVTADATLHKYLGTSFLLTVRAHYHMQTGASFYRSSTGYRLFGPYGQYWTGDRELADMGNYLLGGRFSYLRRPAQQRSSWFVELELTAKYEVLFYLLDPDAPNADRKMAHIFQGAAAMRF